MLDDTIFISAMGALSLLRAQLMAEAVATPIKIDTTIAAATQQQVGSHMAGWFQFQPLWARIVREQPDLLD